MTTTGAAHAPLRISRPGEGSAREAMATIIDVFGIKPRSRVMSILTGVPIKTLDRAWTGQAIRDREQLFLVARFAQEVRDYLFEDPTWSDQRRAAMRTWLTNGEIDLDGRTYRPIDILSDMGLTKRALAELYRAT